MKIPVLNCNKVYINSQNEVSLTLKTQHDINVAKDGWMILRYCDGTKDLDSIFEIVSEEFEVSREDFFKFICEAEKIKVIQLTNDTERIDINLLRKDNISLKSISLELTDKCNLRCIYCYGNYKKEGIFFDFTKVDFLFKMLSDNGITNIELTGGEPLRHPQFKDILQLAINTFRGVTILSNGVLFDDKILEIIKNNIKKVYVQISIDGCSEETNYKIRQVKNTWIKTLHTLKQLSIIEANYRIVFMVTPQNIHEIEDTCKLFRKEGLKNFALSPIMPSFGRACNFEECKFNDITSDELLKIMQKINIEYSDILYRLPKRNNLPTASNNCGIGWKQITVSPQGIVRSCLLLGEDGRIGNIFEQNIMEIFNTDKVSFYANFSKTKNENACKNCSYMNFCGNCIARVFTANLQRTKDGLGLCEVANRNQMNKYFNFHSDFKYRIE